MRHGECGTYQRISGGQNASAPGAGGRQSQRRDLRLASGWNRVVRNPASISYLDKQEAVALVHTCVPFVRLLLSTHPPRPEPWQSGGKDRGARIEATDTLCGLSRPCANSLSVIFSSICSTLFSLSPPSSLGIATSANSWLMQDEPRC